MQPTCNRAVADLARLFSEAEATHSRGITVKLWNLLLNTAVFRTNNHSMKGV